jgi:hypothetical protein
MRIDNALRLLAAPEDISLVNPAVLTFDGTFGVPLEFKTDIAGVELDLAMAVSRP